MEEEGVGELEGGRRTPARVTTEAARPDNRLGMRYRGKLSRLAMEGEYYGQGGLPPGDAMTRETVKGPGTI